MIRHLLGRPCWILTNHKSFPKCPAGQPWGSAHPISSLWSISNYVICITIDNRIFRDERWHLTLTLTSDHISNARNEFLKSGLDEIWYCTWIEHNYWKIYELPSTGVAMLDFDELQEFPKMPSWATKSYFICDIMGTQNHQKTLYFPRFPGCHSGNWTITPISHRTIPISVFIFNWHWPCFAAVKQHQSNHYLVYQEPRFRWNFLVADHSSQISPFRQGVCYSAVHVFAGSSFSVYHWS